VRRRANKKPTVGLVTEVGCLRFELLFPYRANLPHTGALLQQQQMQAPILILWLTGRFLSYSGMEESQFAEGNGLAAGQLPRRPFIPTWPVHARAGNRFRARRYSSAIGKIARELLRNHAVGAMINCLSV
jgi:hypothetical protein